jgi:hypothetical protein
MSRLRMLQVWMATVVLCAGLAVVPGVAAGNTQTFTGKVSDAMCGAKHTEGGIAPAACVRVCVQKGAKYALVVGDKVYTLDTSDKAALDKLEQAGLGAGQSYGHSQRRYYFSEVGDCR